jgi:hypothetical protein
MIPSKVVAEYGWIALQIAAETEDAGMVERLCKVGAKIDLCGGLQ